MKKLFAIVAATAFFGVTAIAAYSLSDKEDVRSAKMKSEKTECATAVKTAAEKPAECGSATNAVLTAGSEKASDCSSATNAVLTAGSEKASDCSSATNAVLTAGSEKASDCSSATNAVLTAGSEKASDCSAPCGSAKPVQTADTAADCSTEKVDDTRIAENK